MITKQEIFNTVICHLRKQQHRSLIKDRCAYRGLDGSMCAAGCLISDQEYELRMDKHAGNTWDKIIENYPTLKAKYGDHTEFIRELQLIHDCYEPSEWEEVFEKTATGHNLKLPEVSNE